MAANEAAEEEVVADLRHATQRHLPPMRLMQWLDGKDATATLGAPTRLSRLRAANTRGGQSARFLRTRLADAGDGGEVVGGVPRRTGKLLILFVEGGGHVVGDRGLTPQLLSIVIALLVRVEVREQLGGQCSPPSGWQT